MTSFSTPESHRPARTPTWGAFLGVLVPVLIVAVVARILLLASGAVSLHSDESVVGLMARHILQGERPVFFYGQAYMGSLDAWLIAGAFRLAGEGLASIRLVQSLLYFGIVISGCAVAWRFSGGNRAITGGAGLLLAVPTVLVALYTTATLGGYDETLLLGNLLLLLAFGLASDVRATRWGRWALLGLCAGLGWWTNNLIVAYALPIAVYLLAELWQLRRDRRATQGVMGVLLAAFIFFIGSLPWWIYNLEQGFPSLSFLFTGASNSALAGMDNLNLSLGDRLIGTLFLGLPSLLGVRMPWMSTYWQPVGALAALAVTLFALFRLLRRPSPLAPGARGLVVGMIGGFLVVFTLSRFSMDPSGRYFLPLALPLAIAIAAGLHGWRIAPLLLAVLVLYQGGGQFAAARENPPGLTTQFNLQTHIPNDHDAELIAFLDTHGLTRGYTNYWIAFRLAFLSQERLIYRAVLPEKSNLTYTPRFERYAPYIQVVERAEAASIAYITANVPEVVTALDAEFAAAAVTYQQEQIGPFTIYYDFTPPERMPRSPLPS